MESLEVQPILAQNRPGYNDNEEILHISQSSGTESPP